MSMMNKRLYIVIVWIIRLEKKTNKLFIFELKVMNFEDRVDDLMLFISICLHVNWKLKWFNHIAQMLTLKFQIWSFKEILNETIKIKDDDVKNWIITNWIIIIKANRSKVTWKQQFINDFNELEWKKILLTLTEEKITDYTIKIKINAKIEKSTCKRFAEIVSKDSDVDERSHQRCICINQLLNWVCVTSVPRLNKAEALINSQWTLASSLRND